MTAGDLILDHARSPRNVGGMADADAEAEDENPVCGDQLHIWLSIHDGVVREMTWEARGCGPAIAAASVTSEIVRGLTLAEAEALDRERIAEALGGLPARKAHAAMLAAATLRKAVARYRSSRDIGQ